MTNVLILENAELHDGIERYKRIILKDLPVGVTDSPGKALRQLLAKNPSDFVSVAEVEELYEVIAGLEQEIEELKTKLAESAKTSSAHKIDSQVGTNTNSSTIKELEEL